jgi:hypothetical protein
MCTYIWVLIPAGGLASIEGLDKNSRLFLNHILETCPQLLFRSGTGVVQSIHCKLASTANSRV